MNLLEPSQRIPALRLVKGLTLEQVSTWADATRSWLSKVENFRITPSLPARGEIAVALETTVSELVVDLDLRQNLSIIRSDERQIIERDRPTSTMRYESLGYSHENRLMDPFLVSLPCGNSQRGAMAHEGEEFLHVLAGRIDLEYDQGLHHLATGDTAYFDATHKHRLINSDPEIEAKIICVFSKA